MHTSLVRFRVFGKRCSDISCKFDEQGGFSGQFFRIFGIDFDNCVVVIFPLDCSNSVMHEYLGEIFNCLHIKSLRAS